MVVYSSVRLGDLSSYYSRLETLLADESEMNKLLKPLKVSRKSVARRSASKCPWFWKKNVLCWCINLIIENTVSNH